jgi:hypothetical protein
MAISPSNPFDQYDNSVPAGAANPFDQFDAVKTTSRPDRSFLESKLHKLAGNAETAAHLATGGAASLGGGLGYLGTLAATGGDSPAAQAVQEAIQNKFTYQPRTKEGQDYSQGAGTAMSYLGQKEGEAAGPWVAEKTGSPLLGAAANTALNIPQFLIGEGMGRVGRAVDAAKPPSVVGPLTPREATTALAVDNGLMVNPAAASKGFVNEGLAKLGDRKAINEMASARNTPRIVDMVHQDLGVEAGKPATPAVLSDVKAKAGQAYDAVRGILGTERPAIATSSTDWNSVGIEQPKARYFDTDKALQTDLRDIAEKYGGSAIDESVSPFAGAKTVSGLVDAYKVHQLSSDKILRDIQILRDQASADFRRADGPNSQAGAKLSGQGQWELATALEDQVVRRLADEGHPEAAQAFQAARTTLAKAHLADLALDEAHGGYKAGAFTKEWSAGKPMNGNMATIGRVASEFPEAMKLVKDAKTSSPMDYIHSISPVLGAGGLGYYLGGQAGAGAGLAALTLGVPALRSAARRIALSEAVQRGMVRNPNRGAPIAASAKQKALANALLRVGAANQGQE